MTGLHVKHAVTRSGNNAFRYYVIKTIVHWVWGMETSLFHQIPTVNVPVHIGPKILTNDIFKMDPYTPKLINLKSLCACKVRIYVHLCYM